MNNVRRNSAPIQIATVGFSPGCRYEDGVQKTTVPMGLKVGIDSPLEFRTVAEGREKPIAFFARLLWWARRYVGGPTLFLTPVAPLDRVPVKGIRP